MKSTIEKLNVLLATYQVYYQNLRGFHWNVVGRDFFELHAQFELLYNEAALAADEIAERILALGGKPLHTYEDFLSYSRIASSETTSDGPGAVEKTSSNISAINDVIGELRKTDIDQVTESSLDDYAKANEKHIWMFRAYLS